MNIRQRLNARQRRRREERGMAVIVVIAIVAILLVYIGGNLRTLDLLSRDLKQIEQKQVRRLSVAKTGSTNAAYAVPASSVTNQSR